MMQHPLARFGPPGPDLDTPTPGSGPGGSLIGCWGAAGSGIIFRFRTVSRTVLLLVE